MLVMCGCRARRATECMRTHSRNTGPRRERPAEKPKFFNEIPEYRPLFQHARHGRRGHEHAIGQHCAAPLLHDCLRMGAWEHEESSLAPDCKGRAALNLPRRDCVVAFLQGIIRFLHVSSTAEDTGSLGAYLLQSIKYSSTGFKASMHLEHCIQTILCGLLMLFLPSRLATLESEPYFLGPKNMWFHQWTTCD